ncbi:MAG: hypothetical protein J7493_09205 [Porphyrobacter sp.]|nr:hypothetical protein [Porphyrobacter sp.]
MIFAIVGIVAAVLIALDARKNIRLGSATTLFGTYSKEERPTAFRIICGVKFLMSVILIVLASMLIARGAA